MTKFEWVGPEAKASMDGRGKSFKRGKAASVEKGEAEPQRTGSPDEYMTFLPKRAYKYLHDNEHDRKSAGWRSAPRFGSCAFVFSRISGW